MRSSYGPRLLSAIAVLVFCSACTSESDSVPDSPRLTSMTALPSSLVVVAGRTRVDAFGSAGKIAWSFVLPDGDTVVSPPVAALSSTTYVRGAMSVYSLAADGKLLWHSKHEDSQGQVKAIVALADSSVAATKGDTLLISFSGDGRPRWTFAMPEGDRMTAPPIVTPSSLIHLRGVNKLYAVDSNGGLAWQADLTGS